MFDLEKFKTGEYFIHTETEEEFNKVLDTLHKEGLRWIYGSALTKERHNWFVEKDNTTIGLKDGEVVCRTLSNAQSAYNKLELEKDMVKSPNHYIGDDGLEVEEVLRNFISRYEDGYVAHRIASAIEYLLRSPLKNGKQDLEKAEYNIQQALEHISKRGDQHPL